MFSGIVEEAAEVVEVVRREGNVDLRVRCSFTDELKIDQSVAHNGVCLTVVAPARRRDLYRDCDPGDA